MFKKRTLWINYSQFLAKKSNLVFLNLPEILEWSCPASIHGRTKHRSGMPPKNFTEIITEIKTHSQFIPNLAHSIVISTVHISCIESMIRGKWQIKKAITITKNTMAKWSSIFRLVVSELFETFGLEYLRALRIWNM